MDAVIGKQSTCCQQRESEADLEGRELEDEAGPGAHAAVTAPRRVALGYLPRPTCSASAPLRGFPRALSFLFLLLNNPTHFTLQ